MIAMLTGVVAEKTVDEIVLDVGVVGVVLPGDGEFFGAETSRSPKHEDVDIVLGETINRLLPFGQSHRGHAHERDVITAQLERFCAIAAEAQEAEEQEGKPFHDG